MSSAFVSEIYSSVQGEGPFTGEKQIFVRLAGCPLRCVYCDTPGSLTARGHSKFEVKKVLDAVVRLRKTTGATTVSATGGEPLAQSLFVKELFRALKKKKFRTYLETAGVHPKALRDVLPVTDVVSMDMKLPSAVGKKFWNEHREFLKIGGKKIFVKVVLEKKSRPEEIKQAVGLLAKTPSKPLLVLQPATPIAGQVKGPTSNQVSAAYEAATARLPRVLVMTQQHKIWGVR